MRLHHGIREVGRWAFLSGVAGSAWIGVGVAQLLSGRDLGAGLQPSYVLFAIAVLAALISEPEFRRRLHGDDLMARWWWLGLGTLLVSGLGLWSSGAGIPLDLAGARFLRQILQWGIMAAIALLTAHRLLADARPDRFVIALAVGIVLQGVYATVGVWQFSEPSSWFTSLERLATSNPAILSGSEELYLGHAFTGIPRVRGTACEPLYLGNLLIGAIPFFVLQAGRNRRWLLLVALGLGLLLATWSRGAWLGGIMAGIVAAALLWRQGYRPGRRLLLALAAVVASGLALMSLLAGPESISLLIDRLRQSLVREDWSNLTRLYSMEAAWLAFRTSPWWGIGWGQFGFHFPLLTTPAGLQSQFDWPVVNNLPLQILAESGLIGFGVFCTTAWLLTIRTFRRLRNAGGLFPSFWLVAAAAAVAGQWFQLLTFSQYNLPHIWIGLGALLAASAPDPEVPR